MHCHSIQTSLVFNHNAFWTCGNPCGIIKNVGVKRKKEQTLQREDETKAMFEHCEIPKNKKCHKESERHRNSTEKATHTQNEMWK